MFGRTIIGGLLAALCGAAQVTAQASQPPIVVAAIPAQLPAAGGQPANPWQCVDLWTDPGRPHVGETIDACREAMRRKFHNGFAATTFVNFGVFEIAQRKFAAALQDLSEAVALDRKNMEALVNRAVAYDGLEDPASAKADRESVTRLHPHDAEDFLSLGTAEDHLGHPQAALAAYTMAIGKSARIRSTAFNAICERGRVYLELGQFDLAVADFTKATQMAPGAGQPLNDRCWARAAVGRELDLALADCNAALNIASQHGVEAPNWLESRGFVYLRQGRYDEAIRDFDAALARPRKQPAAVYLRGLARIRKGESAAGRADIAAAQAMYPEIAAFFTRAGVNP